MQHVVPLVAVFVVAFLLGSIPWGLVISKVFYHKDLREEGSGNIGTTNAIRSMGKVGGYAVEGNSTLQTALRKFKAGDTTTITVYRAGAELELTITFDERPQDPDAEQQAQQQPQQSGEMPSSGSYEDWFNYFSPFFGGIMP